jgi:hypothetical protein
MNNRPTSHETFARHVAGGCCDRARCLSIVSHGIQYEVNQVRVDVLPDLMDFYTEQEKAAKTAGDVDVSLMYARGRAVAEQRERVAVNAVPLNLPSYLMTKEQRKL